MSEHTRDPRHSKLAFRCELSRAWELYNPGNQKLAECRPTWRRTTEAGEDDNLTCLAIFWLWSLLPKLLLPHPLLLIVNEVMQRQHTATTAPGSTGVQDTTSCSNPWQSKHWAMRAQKAYLLFAAYAHHYARNATDWCGRVQTVYKLVPIGEDKALCAAIHSGVWPANHGSQVHCKHHVIGLDGKWPQQLFHTQVGQKVEDILSKLHVVDIYHDVDDANTAQLNLATTHDYDSSKRVTGCHWLS